MPKVYTGTSGGNWEVAENWTPAGVPTNTHAVHITNLTVKVDATAVAGSLELVGGSLLVAGAAATVLAQTPLDAGRTSPVGLQVEGDLLLAGDCSIGGVNQECMSYLTVGGNLTLAGGKALAVYAGARTNAVFSQGGGRVDVAGTTTIEAGSWVYPDCDPYTGAPVVFNLQDLVIAADAGFDATQRGWGYRNLGSSVPPAGVLYEMSGSDYYGTLSPGAGTSFTRGGGYGGKGGNASATRGLDYGYACAPVHPGAPNGMYNGVPTNYRRGGGAVRIGAAHVALDGALHADAGFQSNYGGSSGGGIWVSCSTICLGPRSRLGAVGGDILGNYSSGGGGGRVALGIGLSQAEIESLASGDEPAGLVYEPLGQVLATVRGGQASGLYAPSGTAMLVMGAAADRFLRVVGKPIVAGTPLPDYGSHQYPFGQLATNTVTQISLDPLSGGGVRYRCAGYTLSNATSLVASGTTNFVAATLSQNLTLTWNWADAEDRFRFDAGAHGRVVMGGVTNTGFEQWLPQGTDTTLLVEALPDPGFRFLCWEGDLVPDASFEPALVVPTRSHARSLTARFVPEAPAFADKVFTGLSNGLWDEAGNWTPAGVPTTTDAVYITNKTVHVAGTAEAGRLVLSGGALVVAGATATVTAQTPRDPARTAPVGLFVLEDLWLAGNCSIGGANQACESYLTVGGDLTLTSAKALAVYAGPNDGPIPFKNGGARVTVAGTTTVGTGSWVYPDCHIYTGHPVVFDLRDLAFAEGGGFDATQRGWGYVNAGRRIPAAPNYYERVIPDYWDTTAPGMGFDYSIGAGHGGRGGTFSLVRKRGLSYGLPHAPVYPGSPNGIFNSVFNNYRRGGGAVRIMARQVALDGSLKADAGPQSNLGGSSGGGIWLACQSITYGLSAAMSAQGGQCSSSYSSPGGGGRIAVALDVGTAGLDALFAGETPTELLYESLTQLAVDVTGGRGRITDGVYAYAESGSATLVIGTEADKVLVVEGLPLWAGTPQPGYGSHSFSHGALVTNAVEMFGYPEDTTRIRYRCQGYTLANAEGLVASGTTNWVAIPVSENLTLTWLWGAPEVLVDVAGGGHGSVRRGETEGDVAEWLEPGAAVAAVEAFSDEGYEFLYWLGDVPYGMVTNNPIHFTADVPRSLQALFRLAEPPSTRTWNGGTAAPGAWHDPAQWLPAGNVPGRYDHVVIAEGYCTTTNYAECGSMAISNSAILRVAAWTTVAGRAGRTESSGQLPLTGVHFDEGGMVVHGDLELTQSAQLGLGATDQTYAMALSVGGDLRLSTASSLAVYSGPTNQIFGFDSGSAAVRVGGELRVGTNCWVYPASDRYTGGSPRFDVYRLTIEAGGGFNATERGFDGFRNREPESLAPGRGFSFDTGGGYGGHGGTNFPTIFGQTYGFAAAPILPGSCNGNYADGNNYRRGGGLVRVHAAGPVRLAGSLIADGSPNAYYGGPSGGGIWITAERFRFEPGSRLQVRGGNSSYDYSGGGGGRIALGIKLTGADLAQLAASGTPVSPVDEQDAADFLLRYPGVTVDVTPVKVRADSKSAQPGTFVVLDATRSGTMLMLR